MSPPSLRSMLQTLIAAPSVSSINPQWNQSNGGVIEPLEKWLSDLGFRTEVMPIPDHPGKFNLVASVGSGQEGLILSGHTDTVPCDEALWNHDPLKLTEADNRFYGLGTADMKSFFALALEALRDLDLTRLRQPLTVIATADEESTMSGALALVETGRRLGRHALIGEPTGMHPIRMHKGITMESVRLVGRSGHSSNPALGVSALEGMHKVMGEIMQWRNELQSRFRNPLFEVEVPTINLGFIRGGDNPNRICGACELQFDLRTLPGMALEALRDELQQRLRKLLQGSGLMLEMETPFACVPAMETPATAAIIQAAEQLTGYPAEAVAFGTEGPYLRQLGADVVILGAGDIDQAHKPNEYLALDQVEPMINIIRSLVRRFCL